MGRRERREEKRAIPFRLRRWISGRPVSGAVRGGAARRTGSWSGQGATTRRMVPGVVRGVEGQPTRGKGGASCWSSTSAGKPPGAVGAGPARGNPSAPPRPVSLWMGSCLGEMNER